MFIIGLPIIYYFEYSKPEKFNNKNCSLSELTISLSNCEFNKKYKYIKDCKLKISDKKDLKFISNELTKLKLDIFAPIKFKDISICFYSNCTNLNLCELELFYVDEEYIFRLNNTYYRNDELAKFITKKLNLKLND